MNIICEISSIQEAKKLLSFSSVKGWMIGNESVSLDIEKKLNWNQIKRIIHLAHLHHIQVILNCEQLFHETSFPFIKLLCQEEVWKEIDYFTYSDLGFYQIMTEQGFGNQLIYRAPTYLTNHYDVSLYQKMNAFVVASNQITSDELIQIDHLVTDSLIVDAFGLACCFYSKRPLIHNYLLYKERKFSKYQGKIADLKEETRNNTYHLIEDENGTRIFDEYHYALGEELSKLIHTSYLMIHHLNIKQKKYLEIISLYHQYLNGKIDATQLEENLKHLSFPIHKGAYHNKTVLLKEEVRNE